MRPWSGTLGSTRLFEMQDLITDIDLSTLFDDVTSLKRELSVLYEHVDELRYDLYRAFKKINELSGE